MEIALRFAVTFRISPAAVFGVPEDGVVVLPGTGETQEIVSDAITNTAAKVGHGTLSRYRLDIEKLDIAFAMDDAKAHIEDNFFTVSVDCDSPYRAYLKSAATAEAVLASLSLDLGQPLTHQAVYICDENGQPFPPPLHTNLMKAVTYNLEALKDSINTAVHAASIHDQRLERALHYYEHALILHQTRQFVGRPGTAHFHSMMAAVLLNLWKAVTTIIGEAGTDRDHQKRYREYGIDRDFVLNEIRTLKQLRDDFDVAHYTLDARATTELEAKYGEALSTTTEVIKKYRHHVQSNLTPRLELAE